MAANDVEELLRHALEHFAAAIGDGIAPVALAVKLRELPLALTFFEAARAASPKNSEMLCKTEKNLGIVRMALLTAEVESHSTPGSTWLRDNCTEHFNDVMAFYLRALHSSKDVMRAAWRRGVHSGMVAACNTMCTWLINGVDDKPARLAILSRIRVFLEDIKYARVSVPAAPASGPATAAPALKVTDLKVQRSAVSQVPTLAYILVCLMETDLNLKMCAEHREALRFRDAHGHAHSAVQCACRAQSAFPDAANFDASLDDLGLTLDVDELRDRAQCEMEYSNCAMNIQAAWHWFQHHIRDSEYFQVEDTWRAIDALIAASAEAQQTQPPQLALDAEVCSHLGVIYLRSLQMAVLARGFAERAIQTTQSDLVNGVELRRQSWYQDALDVVRDTEPQPTPTPGPVPDPTLEPILALIRTNAAVQPSETPEARGALFLVFIYGTHPPILPGAVHDTTSILAKRLRTATTHYKESTNSATGDRWRLICRCISAELQNLLGATSGC